MVGKPHGSADPIRALVTLTTLRDVHSESGWDEWVKWVNVEVGITALGMKHEIEARKV